MSVIVPVRDGERFLNRTLRSVLNQRMGDFEVIVVDDGSTDASPAIVAEFANEDDRVRCIEATGQGVAAARNQGIGVARAALIAPLDADDLWVSTKLERQLTRLNECGTDTALAYAWAYLIDADDRVLGLSRPFDEDTMRHLEGDVFLAALYKPFITSGSNPLIRRASIEEVGGYDTALSSREDWDLYIRLAEHSRFALVPEFLVAYRQLPSSRSHDPGAVLRSHRAIMERVLRDHQEVPARLVRWSFSEGYAYAAARALGSHRTAQAARCFAHAVTLDLGQLLRPGPWAGLARHMRRRRLDTAFSADAPPQRRPRRRPQRLRTPFEWLEQRRSRRIRDWRQGRPTTASEGTSWAR